MTMRTRALSLAAAFAVSVAAYSAAEDSSSIADVHFGYLSAVIETLGWVHIAGSREQAVPSRNTASGTEILVAYAVASKLAASDYRVAADRLASYVSNQDEGIQASAQSLVEAYEGLHNVEMKAYKIRTQIMRGAVDQGDARVQAAELRSERTVLLENILLSMKMVVLAAYDMGPGGDPKARLPVAITEPQRTRLLQNVKKTLGQEVTGGPKEDQEVAVAAGAFLFEELQKINLHGPKGK
jgi:hypothetical protein